MCLGFMGELLVSLRLKEGTMLWLWMRNEGYTLGSEYEMGV